MKKICCLIFLFCFVSSIFAANIVKYDPTDSVVPNRVTQYEKSVNTLAYLTNPNDLNSTLPNYLINPNVSACVQPWEYWKVSNGYVVDMNQTEINAMVTAEELQNHNEQVQAVEKLQITLEEAFVAFVKVYNSKVPTQYEITKQEIINQIKLDKGL